MKKSFLYDKIRDRKDFIKKLGGGEMELRDIKELMKILKKEEMNEIKVRYGNIKLTLKNSEESSVEPQVKKETEKKVEEEIVVTAREEIIKSKNIGKIKLLNIEKGMEVQNGTKLATITTIGVETDVKSPVKGILKEILVSDQAAVDFAKPLFIIELL